MELHTNRIKDRHRKRYKWRYALLSVMARDKTVSMGFVFCYLQIAWAMNN